MTANHTNLISNTVRSLIHAVVIYTFFGAIAARAQQHEVAFGDVPWIDQQIEFVEPADVERLGIPSHGELSEASSSVDPPVLHSVAEIEPGAVGFVQPIATHVDESPSHRRVQYDVPLENIEVHREFNRRGIEGRLIKVTDKNSDSGSVGDQLKRFFRPTSAREKKQTVRVVRYEVPAEDIAFHSQMTEFDGEILEPGMLRLPEVRFFQPKARIFSDLKRDNDDEFDLFSDGTILASLDVVELYFPMPLISERFAEALGKSSRLSALGWRVGGTVGLGITTALVNGSEDRGHAPISTLSGGIRYEFPLGRPSREVLETGDPRLDVRTRVGIECGLQGGFSTRETLQDRTDFGLYFGILVNTPWGG